MTRARLAALHLALAAMLLRALLPMGWMPSLGGSENGPLVVCTMDAPVQHNSGKPSPDDGQHSHDECPFAGTPHLATPAVTALLAPPASAGRILHVHEEVAGPATVPAFRPHAPRAPPHRV